MRVALSIWNDHRMAGFFSDLFRQTFGVDELQASADQYSPNFSCFHDARVVEFFRECFGPVASGEGSGLNGISFARSFDDFQTDARGSGSDHFNFASGGEREIDDSSVDEGTAIRDA